MPLHLFARSGRILADAGELRHTVLARFGRAWAGTDAGESATYTTQRSRAPTPTLDMRTPCCADAARSDVLSSVESR